LAAAIGLALTACGGGNIQNAPTPSGGQAANCGKLNMAINPWVGYEASAHVVGYIAKSKLGCEVEYKNVKEEVAWQAWATARLTSSSRTGATRTSCRSTSRAEDGPVTQARTATSG
jgi:ABC-type proline/glycine betaine transport system substrate-binding protein